ncbi:MAG: DUF547 domain-containing protein [Acidobacteriota bacterium]
MHAFAALFSSAALADRAPAAPPPDPPVEESSTSRSFSYSDWTPVLSTFVDDRGRVDYDALAKDRGALDRFLAAVAGTSPVSHPALFPTREEKLAYWINAYNAWVFRGVLARGPEKESVWRGGLVSGYSFFVGMDIVLGGEKTNLKKLEDKTIRALFKDPRIHAALNCASRGCPRLPRKAFEAATLDAELDAAMREFVSEARNVSVDAAARTATLSKIFDWFDGDFLAFEKARGNADPKLLDYVNRYRAPDAQVPRDFRVRFADYDKSLNGR